MKHAYSLMFICFLLNTSTTYAQLDFKIDKLILSHIVETIDNDVFDEDRGGGPFAFFYCSIYNNTDSLVMIYPSKSVCYVEYYYKEKKYGFDTIPLPFADMDSLILSPHQKTELSFGTHLILGTSIYKSDNWDYTYEMLEILPTLKIYYRARSLNIRSSDITRVIIDKH